MGLNFCECGGEVDLVYTGLHYFIVCRECGYVYIVNANNRLDAIKEWNEKRWDK